MNNATLLLGGNMGDRLWALNRAEDEIKKSIGDIINRSGIYETASWGDENLNPFLNQVIDIETAFSPEEVLHKILDIEESMGRSRTYKWASRIIDIDILFFGDEVINQPGLVIPHPNLHLRRFTLVPLVEIHAAKIHPVFKKTCKQLLDETSDGLAVTEYIPLLVKK